MRKSRHRAAAATSVAELLLSVAELRTVIACARRFCRTAVSLLVRITSIAACDIYPEQGCSVYSQTPGSGLRHPSFNDARSVVYIVSLTRASLSPGGEGNIRARRFLEHPWAIGHEGTYCYLYSGVIEALVQKKALHWHEWWYEQFPGQMHMIIMRQVRRSHLGTVRDTSPEYLRRH